VLDGRPVAVSGSADRTVRVWDLTVGQPLGNPLTGHTDTVRAVACMVLDGRPVAVSGSADATVRVWDLADGQPVARPLTGHTDTVRAVACMVLDGRPVAVTGSADRTVRVWDLTTGRCVDQWPLWDQVAAVAISPHGLLVVAAGWEITTFVPSG
jgi:WD40 repeat protein